MSQIQLFKSNDGNVSLEVSLDNDTVWLTQAQVAILFDTSTDNVSLHLKNIFQDKELEETATTEEFSVVREACHLHNVFKEGELIEESNMQKIHIANRICYASLQRIKN